MLRAASLVLLTKMLACMDMEVQEKYLTLDREDFIKYFNSQNFSWKITENNRSFYYGSLETPIRDPSPELCSTPPKDLPANFDAREKWPECETIKEIYDQGDCGSGWAFGAATSASDRTCIHKKVHVRLSEQDLQCFEDRACERGNSNQGIKFWHTTGLVTNKCKPYDIEKLKNDTCRRECVDKNIIYYEDKHYAEKVYAVFSFKDIISCIKSELVQNGSVNALFKVYKDFEDYRGGVYEHKYGEYVGTHTVRVIGYGVEGDQEYWLAANSWSDTWGENGFFRIKINEPVCSFESDMYTGIPQN